MRRRAFVVAALILAVGAGAFLRTRRMQWDLKVYLQCARTLAGGGDPYASMPLLEGSRFQCLYPPVATDLYRPFAAASDAWGHDVGERLWAALKIPALFLMLWLWRRWLLRPGPDLPRLLFVAFAYGSPFWSDFRSGNAASFEHLVLWAGLAAFAAGQDMLFASLIAVAAVPKLIPVAFLPLVLAQPRPRWRAFLVGAAAAAALFGLNEWLHPGLLKSFFLQLGAIDQAWKYERGPNNCSVLGFLHHILETVWGNDRYWSWPRAQRLHLVWSAGVAAATAFALRREWSSGATDAEKRRRSVLLYTAAYALVAPRLKDYSFLLLMPATIAVLESDLPRGPRAFLLLLTVLDSTKGLAAKLGMGRWDILAGYFKLYAAVLVWGLLVRSSAERGRAL